MNDRFELFECRQISGIDVDECHYQKRKASLRGRLKHQHSRCLHEFPELGRSKLKHSKGYVDSCVVIEQTSTDAIEKGSRGRQLSRSGRAMNEHEFHTATVWTLPDPVTSAFGTSRHFVATQQFSRFWSQADIRKPRLRKRVDGYAP